MNDQWNLGNEVTLVTRDRERALRPCPGLLRGLKFVGLSAMFAL